MGKHHSAVEILPKDTVRSHYLHCLVALLFHDMQKCGEVKSSIIYLSVPLH
jgi:hypothetical protein